MRLVAGGSRVWQDVSLIQVWLEILHRDQHPTVVRVGDATGADRFIAECAEKIGIPPEIHPAMWKIWGTAAGPIRNRNMLDLGADLVLAFRMGEISDGTDDLLSQAREHQIPAIVVHPDGSFENLIYEEPVEQLELDLG